MNRILRDANNSIANIRAVSVTNKDGIYVSSTDNGRIGQRSGLDYDLSQTVPFMRPGEVTGDGYLSIHAHSPMTLDGEVLGLVLVEYEAVDLNQIIQARHGLGQTGETYLVWINEEGVAKYITTLRYDALAKLTRSISLDKKNTPEVLALKGQSTIHKNLTDYRQVPVLAVTGYLARVQWGLITKIDQTEAYSSYSQLRNLLLSIIVLFTIINVVAAIFLSRSITNPIDHLTELAHKARRGERGLDFYNSQASDREILALTKAYKDMALEFLETFDSAANGMLVINNQKRIQRLNKKVLDLFGYRMNELVGKNIDLLISKDKSGEQNLKVQKEWSHCLDLVRSESLEILGLHKNGELIPLNITISPFEISEETLLLVTVQDISEQVEYEQKLLSIANYNSLTKLPNRRFFHELIEQEIENAKKDSRQIWLFFVDLDGFKHINDTFGHNAGDTVLKLVASRLNNPLRSTDTVARLGGDEFVILFEPDTQFYFIDAIAKTLLESCSQSYPLQSTLVNLSISIGIANYPMDASNSSDLLRAADKAMYEVKLKGKNNYAYSVKQRKRNVESEENNQKPPQD